MIGVALLIGAGGPVTITADGPIAFDDSRENPARRGPASSPPDAISGYSPPNPSSLPLPPPTDGQTELQQALPAETGLTPVEGATPSARPPTTSGDSAPRSNATAAPSSQRPSGATTGASVPPSGQGAPTPTAGSPSTAAVATAPATTSPPRPSATTPAPTASPVSTAPPTTGAPAPTAAPTQTVDVLAMGDIGICGSQDPARVASLLASQPGQIIALGDVAYPDGRLSEIQECFGKPFAGVMDRIIPVSGNHEYGTGNANGWKQFFGENQTYYSQTIGAWKLIVLDTECEYVGGCGAKDPQQKWLAQQLATAPSCTVVAMHRPYRVSSGYDLETRSRVIHEMALAANVDIILSAHEHIYEHLDFGVTQQFVVGTGGAGIRSPGTLLPASRATATEHGALALNLSSDGFSWRFLNTGTTVLDSGSASCG